MIQKKFMISTVKKQTDLLSELLRELETRPSASIYSYLFCYERIKLLESNLKKMRKLSQSYGKNQRGLN